MVAIIHLVIFFTLVISLQQNYDRLGRRGTVETILDLSILNRNNAPKVTLVRPDNEKDDKDISAKPLTVIPPVPVIPKMEPAAPTAGDILAGIGQFLACGASSFEYLNPLQQLNCRRIPWQAMQMPNGSLVLSPLPQLVIQQTAPQFGGAQAQLHQSQTGSGCPIMLNGPCMSDLFTGNNSRAPGIPDPH